MTTKRSVSLAIRDAARPGAVLIVQRPDDDEDLPGAWGLPAASLASGESWQDAARRVGSEKLGVVLTIGRTLNAGELQRSAYTLHMRLYEATVDSGTPAVPQPAVGVTQYQAVRWGSADDLMPAARRGSLCCRLWLRSEMRKT
jgi:8-oxo-dGTP diphosphatase